ncbi:MAG: 3-deoxy-D-manno-octulosonic acid transferase [Rhodobacteraceae bacterium]|nr:3-deoxy-D-manno-octulosonic acid transferase [Paracoccaceae bacterium]
MLGKDSKAYTRNRFGNATEPRKGPVIWLHAASVGELQSVKQLLKHLGRRHRGHQILVTTNNTAALDLAAGWRDLPLTLQAAPMDTRRAMNRFLDHWQPQAFINIEGELWPNRLIMLKNRNIPVVFVNARLSNRSAGRWGGTGFGTQMLAGVRACFCQDAKSAENFAFLGVPDARIEVIQNLKSLHSDEGLHPEKTRLQQVFSYDKTILAASTHKGEDEVILAAFAQACRDVPDLKLILAPRHPKRGDEVAKLIDATGLRCKRRSKSEKPDKQTQVYLVDTLGEMGLFYRLSAVTFVAGSLVPKRGHTPYEPIGYGSAIISGSHVENFAAEYQMLEDANGCVMVQDSTMLASAILALLDVETRMIQIENARNALAGKTNTDVLFEQLLTPLELVP